MDVEKILEREAKEREGSILPLYLHHFELPGGLGQFHVLAYEHSFPTADQGDVKGYAACHLVVYSESERIHSTILRVREIR